MSVVHWIVKLQFQSAISKSVCFEQWFTGKGIQKNSNLALYWNVIPKFTCSKSWGREWETRSQGDALKQQTIRMSEESLGPHGLLVTRNLRIQDAFNQWRRKGRPQFLECGSLWGRVFTCFWTYKDISIDWFDSVFKSQSPSTWRILYISGTRNHR